MARTPWIDRTGTTTLSDLYDGDLRTNSPTVAHLATRVMIPHPLPGVTYADGLATRADMRGVGHDVERAAESDTMEVHA